MFTKKIYVPNYLLFVGADLAPDLDATDADADDDELFLVLVPYGVTLEGHPAFFSRYATFSRICLHRSASAFSICAQNFLHLADADSALSGGGLNLLRVSRAFSFSAWFGSTVSFSSFGHTSSKSFCASSVGHFPNRHGASGIFLVLFCN
jgi:hypothetical protein